MMEADDFFFGTVEEPACSRIGVKNDPRFRVGKKDGIRRAFEQGPILSFALVARLLEQFCVTQFIFCFLLFVVRLLVHLVPIIHRGS